MNVLLKKLWRIIKNSKGQFLAVAAVITVGISVYISMTTSYNNLTKSQDMFYRENNFADYYFYVVKAPQQVVKQVAAVPGISQATGRIQKDIPVIKEGNDRATARVFTYTLPMDNQVNRVQLLSGRFFEQYSPGGGIEVLVDPQYFSNNRLYFNDQITVVAEGKKVPLTVVGTGSSPEFIYAMKDTSTLIADPGAFGIVMMPQNQAQQILGYGDQINQIVVKLAPGFEEKRVVEQVKQILEPYGNLADYPRKQQLSHAVLQGELDSLKASATFMPAIFLIIAAAIQFVMIGRMVKSQRLQIGIMKALGYSSRQIMAHYTGYALSVALAGACLGTLLGIFFASIFSQLYAQFFNLPTTIGGINTRAILNGFLISITVGLIAGISSSRGVISINPAESMRAEPPKKAGKILLEHWQALWSRLSPTWRMSIRTVTRNKGRFAVTLIGVIFAVGMLVVALFISDSVDYMIKRAYFQEQKYDYLVRFTGPAKESELLNINRLEGVQRSEPLFEIPVKIHLGSRSEDDLLVGLPRDLTLRELPGPKGKPLHLPDDGILISQRTAKKLGVRVGDQVQLETLLGLGPSRFATVKVIGINEQIVGYSSFISLEQANRILGERQLISGAMLRVDPAYAGSVEKSLSDMKGLSSILSRQNELDSFNKNLDALVYSIAIMVSFAVVLGFAIVYNSSVISFAERKRELASLRVLGFTSGEVSDLLLKENLLQSTLGVILGLPFGLLMAHGYIQAVSTDLFTFPVVVYPSTYLLSALGGVLFILIGHRMASKGVAKLDLVEVLKNRD